MPGHSKQELLERLQKGTVRFQWGGVLALERAILDLSLQEQFTQALGEFSFVEPINLQAELEQGSELTVSFHGLIFGAPRVSFERATVTGADLTVWLDIIAGQYVREVLVRGRKRVVESFTISQGMGYRIEAQVTLRVDTSASSRYASLVLDLAAMRDLTSNLGPTDYANRMIGLRLQEYLGYMPVYRRSYTLARFDLQKYYPLSPGRVEVRAMAAPWGQAEGSARHGDGAVLLFMQLGVDARAGGVPDPLFDFPYPIPEEATGLPATLILDPTIPDVGLGDARDVLKTLQMTNGYTFADSDQHVPLDWVLFGNWEPGEDTVSIVPTLASVTSGGEQGFALQGAQGAAQWSARNLQRPLASGSFEGATYHARGVSDFAQEQQLVVVTATYPEGEGEGRRHALVMEHARTVQVVPHVATWAEGYSPIELRTASSEDGELEWSLGATVQLSRGPLRRLSRATGQAQIADALGTLEDLGGGRARFTPFAPNKMVPEVLVQCIKSTNRQSGDSAECAVVIIAFPDSLALAPYHVPALRSSQTVQFSVTDSNRSVTWHIFGEGDIDADGLYTPPDSPTLPVSVIMADDGDERVGYAIVEFSEGRDASAATMSYTSLSTFELHVVGASACVANGWQQLEVDILVAASDGPDGETLEISDADMATLRLRVEGSSNAIPFLDPDQDGIDLDSGLDWAVSLRDNKINRSRSQAGHDMPSADPKPEPRQRRFYVHTRNATTIKVYAEIQNTETFEWFYSNSRGEHGKVDLTGTDVPHFIDDFFPFQRQRLEDHSDKPLIDGDEFVYVENSLDYWRLTHVLRSGTVPVKFVQLKISVSSNQSLIRWASQQYEEEYCSYTGFAFHPAEGFGDPDRRMIYDGSMYRISKARTHNLPDIILGEAPASGELLISLNRRSDIKFWNDVSTGLPYRAKLEKPLVFELIDAEGNQHKLQINFGIDSADMARNLTTRDKLQLRRL